MTRKRSEEDMERAEIDHLKDFLLQKMKQLSALRTEIKDTLPELDGYKRDVGNFDKWPVSQQIASSADDISKSLDFVIDDIDWLMKAMDKMEADDESAPQHALPAIRSTSFMPERLGGVA